ncbi:hypothetical protein Mgra_00008114, partial [Meloidogyne graminicola]
IFFSFIKFLFYDFLHSLFSSFAITPPSFFFCYHMKKQFNILLILASKIMPERDIVEIAAGAAVGAAAGAAANAAVGAIGGPAGAAIGGAVGTIVGVFKNLTILIKK